MQNYLLRIERDPHGYKCRHVDQVHTRVSRCALQCGTGLVPRCVHVPTCLCGAVQHSCVSAVRSRCVPLFFRTGHAECMITEESTTSSP